VRAMATPAAWNLPERALNIGTSTATAILDLARLVIARAGSSSPIQHVPYNSVFLGRTDLRGRVPDTARLESLIGPLNWPSIESVVDEVIAEKRR
jgi:UDP-glucose 4-epimerase